MNHAEQSVATHKSTSGSRANNHGRIAEDIITTPLLSKGYTLQRQVYVGTGIYDTAVYADIVVDQIPLIIESKWQSSGGSVDEKYPYLVANIQHCYPYPTVIVLHGSGYRKGALDWLKSQVYGQIQDVFTFEEYLKWVLKSL